MLFQIKQTQGLQQILNKKFNTDDFNTIFKDNDGISWTYDGSNVEAFISNISITSVYVDDTSESLQQFIASHYQNGDEFGVGDIIILSVALNGVQVWMHNGGTTGTSMDFARISVQITESYVRTLFTADSPVIYNQNTGNFSLDQNYVTGFIRNQFSDQDSGNFRIKGNGQIGEDIAGYSFDPNTKLNIYGYNGKGINVYVEDGVSDIVAFRNYDDSQIFSTLKSNLLLSNQSILNDVYTNLNFGSRIGVGANDKISASISVKHYDKTLNDSISSDISFYTRKDTTFTETVKISGSNQVIINGNLFVDLLFADISDKIVAWNPLTRELKHTDFDFDDLNNLSMGVSADYIQNQNLIDQLADFKISGNGTANTFTVNTNYFFVDSTNFISYNGINFSLGFGVNNFEVFQIYDNILKINGILKLELDVKSNDDTLVLYNSVSKSLTLSDIVYSDVIDFFAGTSNGYIHNQIDTNQLANLRLEGKGYFGEITLVHVEDWFTLANNGNFLTLKGIGVNYNACLEIGDILYGEFTTVCPVRIHEGNLNPTSSTIFEQTVGINNENYLYLITYGNDYQNTDNDLRNNSYINASHSLFLTARYLGIESDQSRVGDIVFQTGDDQFIYGGLVRNGQWNFGKFLDLIDFETKSIADFSFYGHNNGLDTVLIKSVTFGIGSALNVQNSSSNEILKVLNRNAVLIGDVFLDTGQTFQVKGDSFFTGNVLLGSPVDNNIDKLQITGTVSLDLAVYDGTNTIVTYNPVTKQLTDTGVSISTIEGLNPDDFVQNQISNAQNADYWISGRAVIGNAIHPQDPQSKLHVEGIVSFTDPVFQGLYTQEFTDDYTVTLTNIGIGTILISQSDHNVRFTMGTIMNESGARFGNDSGWNNYQIIVVDTVPTFNTDLGYHNITSVDLNYQINNTGTYSGAYRGIYYHPTIVSLTGTKHIAFENTSGDNYFNSSINNTIIGSQISNNIDRLQVYGTVRIDLGVHNNSDIFVARNISTGQLTNTGLSYTDLMQLTTGSSGDYIQNENTNPQTADFYITGNGRLNTLYSTSIITENTSNTNDSLTEILIKDNVFTGGLSFKYNSISNDIYDNTLNLRSDNSVALTGSNIYFSNNTNTHGYFSSNGNLILKSTDLQLVNLVNNLDKLQVYGTMRTDLGVTSNTDTLVSRNLSTGQLTDTNISYSQIQTSINNATSKVTGNIGDGTSTQIQIVHSKNTRDLIVQVYETTGGYYQVFPDISLDTLNTITFYFDTAPSSNQYRYVIY